MNLISNPDSLQRVIEVCFEEILSAEYSYKRYYEGQDKIIDALEDIQSVA